MISNVLALVIDFRTTDDAAALTRQLADSARSGFALTVAHVDNGNAEPVRLSAEQERSGVRLVRVDHNGGYGSGVRKAIEQLRAAGEEFSAFWILNSDLQIEPDTLEKLVAVLRENPRVGAVGPNVYKGRTGRVWGARGVVSPWTGLTGMSPWPRGGALPRWSYIPGCSLLVRAAAYDDVDGIPDRYGMFYEETHLCVQLQRRGWDLWVEPGAAVYHDVHSMEAGIPKPYQAFYFTRNNLYFWKANFGIPSFVQLPRMLFAVTKDLVLPLRRARSAAELLGRLRFVGMGIVDSFRFIRHRYTPFERKYFDIAPKQSSGPRG